MHDKFIVRDGASVWSGSGNFTNGGLLLQDNQFFIMASPAISAGYSKTFGDLGSPGHSATHTANYTTGVAIPPIQVTFPLRSSSRHKSPRSRALRWRFRIG